ncbi:MAG: N-acetylmuramoyl-L-alanine amidase [Chloroflexota bacterium]
MTQNKQTFSRREVLLALGILGAGSAACVCSGGIAGAWLLSQRTPEPSNTPLPLPTTRPTPSVARPPIIDRASWGAQSPNHNARNETGFYSENNPAGWRVYDEELDSIYRTVIIHHAAFYADDDLSTVREVQNVHFNQRGWADVGYHFMVGKNGIIYAGRDWHVRGTHVSNYNTGSLGICLLGNFAEEAPTEAQLNSTLDLLLYVTERLQLTHIATHREFNAQTQCPGDNLYVYLEQFAGATELTIGIDGYVPPDDGASCDCGMVT